MCESLMGKLLLAKNLEERKEILTLLAISNTGPLTKFVLISLVDTAFE